MAGTCLVSPTLVGQFEVVFHIVLEPTVKLRQFSRREPRNGGFNFLNRADKKKDAGVWFLSFITAPWGPSWRRASTGRFCRFAEAWNMMGVRAGNGYNPFRVGECFGAASPRVVLGAQPWAG